MLCSFVGFKAKLTAPANSCAFIHFSINKVVLKTRKKNHSNMINEIHF